MEYLIFIICHQLLYINIIVDAGKFSQFSYCALNTMLEIKVEVGTKILGRFHEIESHIILSQILSHEPCELN